MSRIDEELEQAVRATEAQEVEQAGTARGVETDDDDGARRGWALLLGLLAIGGGILALVFNSGDSMIYAYEVDQLTAKAAELGNRQVKVTGNLVSGTLVHRALPTCEFRFTIEKNGAELPIRFPQCILPDTFKDVEGQLVEVSAEGRLEDGHLNATHIFAKCPSKYEGGEGEQALNGGVDGKVDHKGMGPKQKFIAPRMVENL